MATELPAHKRKKPRSPSYPGINLPDAIERAQGLYDAERRNAAPVDLILQHWGYKPKSGAGMVVLAALKKFRLLEDEGSGLTRRARLTDLALDIILDTREGSQKRANAIQEAALAPGIHRELLQSYPGGLPSDASLIFHLERELGFTPQAAREVVKELRSTLAFAGLDAIGDDTLSRQEPDRTPVEESPPMSQPAPPQPSHAPSQAPRTQPTGDTAYPIPLPDGARFSVHGTFPLTEEDWDYVMSYLTLMKRGLVAPRLPAGDQ
jgi:hypothetical protein